MPTDQTPKQLVAQRIKDATNILVTVSRDPDVDQLSAALALTLLLDKMGKTATAVFSGKIPSAISFLEPGKTFDNNVDSLRDFIIALDKEKADRLRYKVEDDVVRVFITPYKTTITEKDLTFSQGDFNVDLIVAFGVEKHDDLDTAITAHGRILHDASVVTVNLAGTSSLGEVDWTDAEASSLCEMLMGLTESLQPNSLDQPIATAILTGLVSSTDRFRNDKTSPKVMTIAAQLMAAGANQQLIAAKLEEAAPVSVATEPSVKKDSDGEMRVEHVEGEPDVEDSGEVELAKTVDEALAVKEEELAAEESADAIEEAKEELATVENTSVLPSVEPKTSNWRDANILQPASVDETSTKEVNVDEPVVEVENKNRVILSHDSPAVVAPADFAADTSVINAATMASSEPSVQDIFAVASDPSAASLPGVVVSPTADVSLEPPSVTATSASTVLQLEELPTISATTQPNPTLADLEAEVARQEQQQASPAAEVDAARASVDALFGSTPFDPAGHPLAAVGAQTLGDVSHEAAVPVPAVPTMPGLPPLPPLPDFSTLPPLPGEVVAPTTTASTPVFGLPEQPELPDGSSGVTPTSSDPGEFKLPGQ